VELSKCKVAPPLACSKNPSRCFQVLSLHWLHLSWCLNGSFNTSFILVNSLLGNLLICALLSGVSAIGLTDTKRLLIDWDPTSWCQFTVLLVGTLAGFVVPPPIHSSCVWQAWQQHGVLLITLYLLSLDGGKKWCISWIPFLVLSPSDFLPLLNPVKYPLMLQVWVLRWYG
jgi:hypothetical protein